jgi:hypothetical protein
MFYHPAEEDILHLVFKYWELVCFGLVTYSSTTWTQTMFFFIWFGNWLSRVFSSCRRGYSTRTIQILRISLVLLATYIVSITWTLNMFLIGLVWYLVITWFLILQKSICYTVNTNTWGVVWFCYLPRVYHVEAKDVFNWVGLVSGYHAGSLPAEEINYCTLYCIQIFWNGLVWLVT